ncbi:MAG: DUF6125 family protein [Archaeoglobaceae archaeon]|nr:DUF6125 family protein [Archaeoglobaceae archaeon]MDW8128722.1 DUF6125 family protein [Archaeoglobaceae archaeon]
MQIGEEERAKLKNFSTDQLIDLLFLQVRNIWRVDGLYFLGIEEKFGTAPATEIDANCWISLAKIEAKELKKIFGLDKVESIKDLLELLSNTSWALYQTKKEIEISENSGIFRVVSCKIQEARLKKGLQIFPCKRVRFGYLKSFAEELNENFEVICKTCPPDKKPENCWCEWEFRKK